MRNLGNLIGLYAKIAHVDQWATSINIICSAFEECFEA